MKNEGTHGNKGIVILLELLLGILIFAFGILICIKPVVNTTVKKNYVNQLIWDGIMVAVSFKVPQIDTEQRDEIYEEIKRIPEVGKIIHLYLEAIAENYDYSDYKDLDADEYYDKLNQRIIKIIERKIDEQLSEEQEEVIIKELERMEERIVSETYFHIVEFDYPVYDACRIYLHLTMKVVPIGAALLIGIIGSALIYMQREKQKWLISLGRMTLTNAIILGIFIPAIIHAISDKLTEYLFENAFKMRTLKKSDFYVIAIIA